MNKTIGTKKDGLTDEDALKFDALERFRQCCNLRYGVSESTFDRIWLRLGLPVDRHNPRRPEMWLDAGRHTLAVTIDADVADGQFSVETIP